MKKRNVVFYALGIVAVWLTIAATSSTGQEGGLDEQLAALEKRILWGSATNGLTAGIDLFSDWPRRKPPEVAVYVRSMAPTNVNWGYLILPNEFPGSIELETKEGQAVEYRGTELSRKYRMQRTVALKDLPRDRRGSVTGHIALRTNAPTALGVFNMNELFALSGKTGEFQLTIWVKIYKFSDDHQAVSLVELQPVTTSFALPFGSAANGLDMQTNAPDMPRNLGEFREGISTNR